VAGPPQPDPGPLRDGEVLIEMIQASPERPLARPAPPHTRPPRPPSTLVPRPREPGDSIPRPTGPQAPINPSDINVVEGRYPLAPPLPAVPGNEGVGRVVASASPALAAGDRVVPLRPGLGAWRQSLVADASGLVRVRPGVPDAAAATLSVNPPTALHLLRDFVELRPGDVVVQNAANSGVGRAVIEVARALGVATVNVVRMRPGYEELCAELAALGADEVTTEEQLPDVLAGMRRPRLALNAVGGRSAASLARGLEPGGTLVTYGGMSREPVSLPTGLLIFRDLRARGFWLSGPGVDEPRRRAVLDELQGMAERGLLAPATEAYGFGDWRDAVARAQEPRRAGKVVLHFGAD